MILTIIDSATGETLGTAIILGMDDERILQWLIDHGYLSGSPDEYDISRCYPFAEGEILVLLRDNQTPVLKLELPDAEAA